MPFIQLQTLRSVLVILMVSVTQGQMSSSPCLSSCVVCSEDAIICYNLSSMAEVPGSTKALMLTDGWIETLDSSAFAGFSNMSILVLSNNIISTIVSNAFQKAGVLQTLQLDRNRISSQALDRWTFSWLHKLETLDLGYNALRDISGSWFQSTIALKTLLLAGNLLAGLNSSTFALSDLRNLETLDLSDNLITYVGRDSFRNLGHLRVLDLARNRLQNAPDAFSHLLWLSKLNLDMNHWSCTCELRELAYFLKSYVQSPGRSLHNGKGMACSSSVNPAVQTVLELTKANCMPANGDVRVKAVRTSPITPQRYVRDVSLAAALSCLVGVVITLAILAGVYRKLSKTKPWHGENGAEELSSPASTHWELYEGKDALSISDTQHNTDCHAHQSWDTENTSSDSTNHLMYHNCSLAPIRRDYVRETFLQGTTHMGILSNHTGTDPSKNSAMQSWTKDVRAQDSRHNGKQVCCSNTSQKSQRVNSEDMTSMRMRQIALRMDTENIHGYHLCDRTHDNGPERAYQTLNCLQCHQTYEYIHTGTQNQTSLSGKFKHYTPPRWDKPSNVILYGDILSNTKLQRSLTFELFLDHDITIPKKEQEGPYRIGRTKMSKTLEEKSRHHLGKILTKRNSSRHSNSSSQGHKKLKVKLNLNPLRRCHVHPKSSRSYKTIGGEITSRKTKKDKPLADEVKKETKKPKKGKATMTSPRAEGSRGQGEKQGLKSSSKTIAGNTDTERTNSQQIGNPEITDNRSSTKKSIHESQNSNEPVQKSSPLLRCSDQIVITQPFISANDTDPDQPVSTSEDPNVKTTPQSLEEFPEKSIPLLQGLELTGSTDTSFTQTLSMANTVHNHKEGSNYKDTTTTTSVQMPVLLSPSAELLFTSTDNATTQPVSMENTTYPHQAMNQGLDLSLTALDLCRDTTTPISSSVSVLQEYLSSDDGSTKRKIRLILPEKTPNRPQSALDKKIR